MIATVLSDGWEDFFCLLFLFVSSKTVHGQKRNKARQNTGWRNSRAMKVVACVWPKIRTVFSR